MLTIVVLLIHHGHLHAGTGRCTGCSNSSCCCSDHASILQWKHISPSKRCNLSIRQSLISA